MSGVASPLVGTLALVALIVGSIMLASCAGLLLVGIVGARRRDRERKIELRRIARRHENGSRHRLGE